MKSEHEIRLEKLKEIKKAGINPYPVHFDKQHNVAEILSEKDGKKLKTAGRIMTMRVMGKLCFCHLQDGSGKAQIALKQDEAGKDEFKFFTKKLDMGDFVGVEGKIFTTHKGEKTLLVKKFELLSKALF